MWYKLIELSRSFIRCSNKCPRLKDGAFKEIISNAFSRSRSKPDFKRVFFVLPKDSKLLSFIRNKSLIILLKSELKQMEGIFKENTIKVTKSCVSQLEFVVAYRTRRAQQLFTLYSKLWQDNALRIIVAKLRKQLMLKGRAFMLGLSAAAVFNWDEEMIKDHELTRHTQELDLCNRLKARKGGKVGKPPDQSCQACDSSQEDSCWEPFVSNAEILCWKREAPHKRATGRFCYKVYGAYTDVSAQDFLEAFLQIEERKSWDTHVVNLHVISSDPKTNSDLIYWEIKYPSIFSNRDYVYKRRYTILEKENLIVVCNQSTNHPDYPVHSNITRVTDYWSYLVIKPFTSFDKTGMEFSLTYFDDPGTALPSAISSWASSVAMPEFMKKLRLAAKKVGDSRGAPPPPPLPPPIVETPKKEIKEKKKAQSKIMEKENAKKKEENENGDSCSEYGFFSFFYPPSNEDELIFQMLISW